jgi:hypothetical protein
MCVSSGIRDEGGLRRTAFFLQMSAYSFLLLEYSLDIHPGRMCVSPRAGGRRRSSANGGGELLTAYISTSHSAARTFSVLICVLS